MKKNFLKNLIICFLLMSVFLFGGCSRGADSAYSGQSIDAHAAGEIIAREMDLLIEENKDDYATYFDEKEYKQLSDSYYGNFTGVGIYILKNKNDEYPIIVGTMQGRPAQKGGLLPGDILISVDDEDTASLSSMAVSEKVKGKIGSKVKLGIERKKQKMSFTLTREKIELETVRGMILENHPQIAYLAIGEFSENTAQEFINIYNDLQKKHGFKGLIIDLRDNGGGSLGASVDLASYFVPKNEVVVWQKKKDGLFNSKSEDGRLALPVVCLQNESSASASEVFLGAMKDYDLAETIGKKTFGKGITQSIYQVRSGGALRYTESHYFTPNKYDLHGKGIPPDIEIDNPAKFIYDVYKPDPVQDKQLKKAIDVLQEKLQ